MDHLNLDPMDVVSAVGELTMRCSSWLRLRLFSGGARAFDPVHAIIGRVRNEVFWP